MILALSAVPAPYGGAVRLTVSSSDPDSEHALVLATGTPAVPDPVTRDQARTVHYGRLTMHAGGLRRSVGTTQRVSGMYTVMDLDTRELPDLTPVFYHAFTLLPGGGYGPPVSVSATPACVRQAAVLLARDLVRARLEYHLDRGVRDGALPGRTNVIPVLEQEVLEEGFNLPAVLLKESASPAPGSETVGKGGDTHLDVHDGSYRREYRHTVNARVDLLVLSQNAEERALLEKYLHGVLVMDVDYYDAAGLEGAEVMRSTRHDVDPSGANYYTVELTVSGVLTIAVTEHLASVSLDT